MKNFLALRLSPAVALAFTVACAADGAPDGAADDPCATASDCAVTITHGAVAPVGTVAGADDGVGTERLFHGDVTFVDLGAGYFDATMTTISVDAAAGIETRITTIVFVLDETGDQLILEGSSTYPTAGSTIEAARTVRRPVIGGAGAWEGARGAASSTHLDDDTWKHEFSLVP